MGWKSIKVSISILVNNFQFIHSKIINQNKSEWMFTIVYNNPKIDMKRVLWKDLQDLSSNILEAWLLARDFNDIRNPF